MATIYYSADGAIQQMNQDADSFQRPQPANTSALVIDETTNAALIADIHANWSLYAVPNGTLQKSGKAVTIAAASPAANDAAFVHANAVAIFMGLRAGTLTQAQMQRVLAYLLRQVVSG